MKEKLFVNALSSLLIVSDYAEYLDTHRSFIVDNLCKLGCPEEAAINCLLNCVNTELKQSEQFLTEIERRGLSDEFESWSDQDEVIEERKHGILTALSLGMSITNDPHSLQ